ncbi:unnamed protein product [Caenorhabditis auriculariae]|uniref:C2H2-type domain-containing protein n=1 Tax=Caenorhabditis auriculariae TaxID=2777116 RepID=A0A8S1HSH7_9PELO|nr:unnamed protein product [Caenorhabditis auriculariae]
MHLVGVPPEDMLAVDEEAYEEEGTSSSVDVPCDVMDPMFYVQNAIYDSGNGQIICSSCMDEFPSYRKVYAHLFDMHGFSKQQIEVIKAQRRISLSQRNRNNQRKQTIYSCEYCDIQFVSKSGLMNHKKRLHNVELPPTTSIDNIVCPSYGCGMSFFTYMDLAIHVDSCHRDLTTISDCFRIHRDRFPDKASYAKWRKTMEIQTDSQFYTRTTDNHLRYGKKSTLLKCLYSNTRGHSKGRRCEQCPAFIRMCERYTGELEVVACFGHLGHEHSTETRRAAELRERKWREFESMQDFELQQNNGEETVVEAYVISTEEEYEEEDVQFKDDAAATTNKPEMDRLIPFDRKRRMPEEPQIPVRIMRYEEI